MKAQLSVRARSSFGRFCRECGFTLVEMAVVLIVFGLLLGGLLMILTTHEANRRVEETQRLLAQARAALIGFAAVNGRLPCPADPTIPTGSPGAGTERTPNATGCTGGQQGVLPWVTLGLPETDAWGRGLTYRVTALYSRTVIARPPTDYGCTPLPPLPPTQAAFALCSPGDIEVRVASGGPALATAIPAVVVSHGPNGFGARLPTGAQLPEENSEDERENHDDDAVFVERTRAESFDDLLLPLASPSLMQWMLQSGRLP